jgi:hypothetical protein
MKTWKILFIVLFLAQSVSAASFKDVSETKSFSNTLMQYFLREEFVEGLNMAKRYWPLPTDEIDNLATRINTQWITMQKRYGETVSMEFIKEERIGKSFVRHFYLHKFKNHAIYWRFTYYKPHDEWKLNGITFEDDLDPLFE